MHVIERAREALAAVVLQAGLGLDEVQERLHVGLRLGDAGQRILAFYLVEVDERRLYQATSHPNVIRFAEEVLDLGRRRTTELLRVGRKLLELPAIDAAFLEGRIGWSKLLLLMQVVEPPHEAAWLAAATRKTCRDLKRVVRLTKPGRPPREEGDLKSLPEIRYPVRAAVDPVVWNKVEQARRKLSDERGRPMSNAEMLEAVADLLLESEDDGTLPGRKRVCSSAYRVVVHVGRGARDGAAAGPLEVDTPDGPLPIDAGEDAPPLARVRGAVVACDGACGGERVEIHDHDDGSRPFAAPRKTPQGLRERILLRDGHACRGCGCRHGLTVHHIRFRSRGGPTVAWNLIVLCTRCHALVHAGLLQLVGVRADEIVFADAGGRPLADPGRPPTPARLMPILARGERRAGDHVAVAEPGALPGSASALEAAPMPDRIDGRWWCSHASRIRSAGDRGLVLRPGPSAPAAPRRPAPEPMGQTEAFADIAGQSARVSRLARTSAARRARGRAFPHTLFLGPPGTGKTTFARCIAASHGARLTECAGPLLRDPHALLRKLAELDEGDMLFLDEIHAVPRSVLEVLYQAMSDRRVPVTFEVGGRARTVDFHLPRFTVLAATTEDGDLPDALRSRFGLREQLGYYPREDLVALARRRAGRLGVSLQPAAAHLLAASARGTPRELLRLLDRVVDHLGATRAPDIRQVHVTATLRELGYDEQGLDPVEQRYLRLLRQCRRPVPLGRLARMLGASSRTVLQHIEPFLFRRGLIDITPMGRVACAAQAAVC